MTKLDLSVSTTSLECTSLDDETSALLGVPVGSPLRSILADENEFATFKDTIKDLMDRRRYLMKSDDNDDDDTFATIDLVFRVPDVVGTTTTTSIDRSPIRGVFRSPLRAIHTSGVTELSCFTHIKFQSEDVVRVTAIEFSRTYRERKLRQEFGSWLLEDHIESSVIATDPLGTVVFWNRFASELYQYSKEEAMGRNIMDLTPSDMTQEQGMEIFSRLVKGEHWKGFFGVKRKDGHQFIAHVTDTPVVNQENELKFIVGISEDYSQMHDLMEKLKNLNANLEAEVVARTETIVAQEKSLRMVGTAVQESDTGVVITDQNFKIVWCNQAVTRYTPNNTEIIDEYPWDLPLDFQLESCEHERDDPENHRAVHSARHFFESGNRATIQATTRSSEGEEKCHMSVSVQSMPDSKNFVVVFRDLTAERKADEAQRRAEMAAAASQAKTDTMCMLSHEFRTPLQGIMGVVSITLLDLEEGSVLHEQLSTIAASSKLLLTLINNVLDLNKIEANMMQELDVVSMEVEPSVRDAMLFCQNLAKINDVKLTLDRDRGLPSFTTLLGNKLRVEQILINLISNAIKFTRQGTEVTVGIRRCPLPEAISEALNAGASDLKFQSRDIAEASLHEINSRVVVLAIRDQGRGIPDQEMGLLFQEFTQLEVSKEADRDYGNGRKMHSIGQSSGSGLGLSLVLKFLSMMNGHIWVNNNETGGACFSICFPEGNGVPAQIPNTVQGFTNATKALSDFRKISYKSIRVLLVDDSTINLKVLERMLQRLGVGEIVTTNDASDAVDSLLAETNPKRLPNLILSDIQMPGMDGFEFITHLREMTHFKEPPIVMACTADWTTESDERCAQVGFDGVLRKPIILSALDDFLSSIVNSDEFSLSPPSSPLPQKQEQQQGGGGGGTTPDPPGWQIIGCRPVSTGEAACTGGS